MDKPSNINPNVYKPPKKGLCHNISPGLNYRILWYLTINCKSWKTYLLNAGKFKHIAEWKMNVDGAIRYFLTMLASSKCKNYHIKFFKNFMAPFYGWGSTASRLVPLWGGSLPFTTKFSDIPSTHFIDLRRMKGWVDLGATQWFKRLKEILCNYQKILLN